jgi:hypothetical protein
MPIPLFLSKILRFIFVCYIINKEVILPSLYYSIVDKIVAIFYMRGPLLKIYQ